MKKIFLMALMIVSTFITIYAIMFWQPSDKIMADNQIHQQGVESSNNKVNEVNKEIEEQNYNEEKNNKNNEYESASLRYKEEVPVEVAVQSSILKVEESEIEKTIPRDKKERLEGIVKKLSSVDLINIKEKFNKENKEEGFKEGFSIIRTRVSDKDYEEIKEILAEYIDFSVLEVEV